MALSPTQQRLAALQAINAPLTPGQQAMQRVREISLDGAVKEAERNLEFVRARLAFGGLSRVRGLDFYAATRDLQNALARAANARAARAAARAAPPPVNAAERDALQNAAYAEDLLMGNADPRMAAALDALQRQSQEGPYSDEVQNLIAGRSADSAAAAASSQQQALMEAVARSGGSMSDASFGAASRAIDTDRMLNNNAARRDIAIQAALANFQGQNQAASQLASLRSGANSQLADYYANANVEDAGNQSRLRVAPVAAPVALPSYATQPVKAPAQAPAQAPAPAAPRPVVRPSPARRLYPNATGSVSIGSAPRRPSINATGSVSLGSAPQQPSMPAGTGPLSNEAYQQQMSGGIKGGLPSLDSAMNALVRGSGKYRTTSPMARA